MSDFNFPSQEFRSFSDRVHQERAARLEQAPRILQFGIHFLDLALGGIFPNDLVLIGAKTGAGKTALASRIAISNAAKGKRVHYFALEAEADEIERRIKYSHVADMIKQRSQTLYSRLNYLDWYTGALDEVTAPFEVYADKVLADTFKTLFTFYRSGDFYAEHFEKMLMAIQDQTDLVILDHLHYVDSEDPNDNRGYKQIVKKIRDAALSVGKPVVVVAHIRKGERKNPQIVPSIEDFHGTSDIPKIATKAIMIAPAFDQPSSSSLVWPTYISPAKCRFDGTRTRFIGLVPFDVRSGVYADEYDLGKAVSGGEKFEIIDHANRPQWAKL